MEAAQTSGRQGSGEQAQNNRKSVDVDDPDSEPPLYKTDEFRIYCMKVLPCSKRYCHDWTTCPFAHPGEKARRRDPRLYAYTGIACPDMKKDNKCVREDACPYAHNVFEYWLHPTRYRTQLCNDGANCKRRVCFFAHSLEELRVPSCKPFVPPEALAAATAAAGAKMEHPVDPSPQAAEALAAELARQRLAGLSPTGELDAAAGQSTVGDIANRLASLQLAMSNNPGGGKDMAVMNLLSALLKEAVDVVNTGSNGQNLQASQQQQQAQQRHPSLPALPGNRLHGGPAPLHSQLTSEQLNLYRAMTEGSAQRRPQYPGGRYSLDSAPLYSYASGPRWPQNGAAYARGSDAAAYARTALFNQQMAEAGYYSQQQPLFQEMEPQQLSGHSSGISPKDLLSLQALANGASEWSTPRSSLDINREWLADPGSSPSGAAMNDDFSGRMASYPSPYETAPRMPDFAGGMRGNNLSGYDGYVRSSSELYDDRRSSADYPRSHQAATFNRAVEAFRRRSDDVQASMRRPSPIGGPAAALTRHGSSSGASAAFNGAFGDSLFAFTAPYPAMEGGASAEPSRGGSLPMAPASLGPMVAPPLSTRRGSSPGFSMFNNAPSSSNPIPRTNSNEVQSPSPTREEAQDTQASQDAAPSQQQWSY